MYHEMACCVREVCTENRTQTEVNNEKRGLDCSVKMTAVLD